MSKDSLKKINLRVPDGLFQAIKARASKNGIKLQFLIARYLSEGINRDRAEDGRKAIVCAPSAKRR
jgi:predicted DNA binding CopG/RHH family protein